MGAATLEPASGHRVGHLNLIGGAQTRARGKETAMEVVALTTDQSARIEALPDDCTIVGVEDGCPLVRQGGGAVALVDSNGRLVQAEHSVRAVTPYLEVAAS